MQSYHHVAETKKFTNIVSNIVSLIALSFPFTHLFKMKLKYVYWVVLSVAPVGEEKISKLQLKRWKQNKWNMILKYQRLVKKKEILYPVNKR